MYNIYIIIISIILVVCLIFNLYKRNTETFSAIDHPSKCISCEKQYPSQCAWRGQKSKCYSCEIDALRRSGGDECAVFNEHPIKYYELPPIPGMGYPKMGYM